MNCLKNQKIMKHVNDDMRGMINKVKKLQQFESINSNNLNLTDWNSVVKWIEKYGPEQLFDEDGQLDWDHKDTMTGDDLETLIHSYMEKYKDTINEPEIEIYRMVMLNNINDLNTKKIGQFWAFDENSVGAYGITNRQSTHKPFILTAVISTKDIDWAQGLYSFLAYGKTEFECYMKPKSVCVITHVNNETLSIPIKGYC